MTRIEEIYALAVGAKESGIETVAMSTDGLLSLLAENKRMREALEWVKDTQHLEKSADAIVDAALKGTQS